MKFLTPSLTFFAISPVLGSLAMSPWTNTLVRRTGECWPVFLLYPTPGVDQPCGSGYVVGNCNCCPSGQIGCISPAVCTLGSFGIYICAIPGSSTAQCAAGEEACGTRCMPVGADCCGTGATYCPAPEHCGTNPDGSTGCFTSVQAVTTSSTSTPKASTSVSVQTSFPLPSTTPSSHTTTTTSSILTKSTTAGNGASASQTIQSLGTSIQKSSWGVGGAFVMLVIIFFLS